MTEVCVLDLMKLKSYLEILGICFTVALTFMFFANIFLNIENKPIDYVILAFSWIVVLKFNWTARDLWHKWFGK
jgi:nucleosome binding factor SPN SPT16 subunit